MRGMVALWLEVEVEGEVEVEVEGHDGIMACPRHIVMVWQISM